MQAGGWASGTPGWLPAARVFLLGSLVFGYLFSATLFLLSARLIHRDRLKLETVCQSGSLDTVCMDFLACYRSSTPLRLWRTHDSMADLGQAPGSKAFHNC